MRTLKANFIFSLLVATLFFAACKKNNANNNSNYYAGQKYSDASGNFVVINNPTWHVSPGGGGGYAMLKVSGYTNADKITITTYGDGKVIDYGIDLYNQHFDTDISIVIFSDIPAGKFQESTVLKAYLGTDTLAVKLSSGDLQF